MKVAVVGAGPAGLLAAHAATMAGASRVRIYTAPGADGAPSKSVLTGAQFLHERIPGMARDPEAMIKFRLNGTWEQYRWKVYGRSDVVHVSMQDAPSEGELPAWSLRSMYDGLWHFLVKEPKRGVEVEAMRVGPSTIQRIMDMNDLVVSTVPRNFICSDVSHRFIVQEIVQTGGYDKGEDSLPDFTIAYDATAENSWYRRSNVFGEHSAEYSMASAIYRGYARPEPIDLLVDGQGVKREKPMGTNCNCWPRVLHTGRLGSWDKRILSHHAFTMTWDAIVGGRRQ